MKVRERLEFQTLSTYARYLIALAPCMGLNAHFMEGEHGG